MTVLMRSPNFLILDEPTNDLDILTLNVLEEYIQEFKGSVIIVSHDRYFLDKIAQHMFIFEGDGEIKDFPGNYTDYYNYQLLKEKEEKAENKENKASQIQSKPKEKDPKKMGHKEKREFEQLSKEIEQLENEKKQLEEEISSGTLKQEDLISKSHRISEVMKTIDEKSERWLVLSEMN
jgi:ATP-binding cassette subfamily F protein uup